MIQKDMITKVLSLFNLNRRGSGANLNLFRSVAIVLLCVLGVSDAWAGKNSNYYASLKISADGPTGAGKVYVTATKDSKPTSANPGTAVTSDATSSSGGNVSLYYYIDINPGYNVQLSRNITKAYGSFTAANGTQQTFTAAAATSNGSTKAYEATATFVKIDVTAVDNTTINLNPTDPSAKYDYEVNFTVPYLKAIATDLTNSPTAASGKWTAPAWTSTDLNTASSTVKCAGSFQGDGTYGGLSRTNSTTISLQSKASSPTVKTCTVTANYPNAKITDGSADEVFATYKSTDATQEGVEKTAVFDVENVDGTNNFDTPTFTGADASHFTYNSMSYADGKLTVNYTYNGNKESGIHTATLTLKVNDAIGGTDATYGSKAIMITAHNEQEATDDAKVVAADGETLIYQGDWATALSKQADGYTLTLLRNVDLGTLAATQSITTSLTLDLNGKTLSGAISSSVPRLLYMNNANKTLTIKDSKTGGKLSATGSYTNALYCVQINNGNVILESGSLEITNENTSQTTADRLYATGVYVNSGKTFTMNGGSITANRAARDAYGIYVAASATARGKATINNGTINVSSNTYAYGIRGYGDIIINGGTINAETLTGAYAYGVHVRAAANATAASGYAGSLTMSNGTINSTSTTSYAYGIYMQTNTVGTAATVTPEGTHSNQETGELQITGGTIRVINNGNVAGTNQYAYGIYTDGDYSSKNAKHITQSIKGLNLYVEGSRYVYGIYAAAGAQTNSACNHADVELTGNEVEVFANATVQAYAVYAGVASRTVYASTANYAGEYASAAKVTINSGTYRARTTTTTAYAVCSSTRAKTTFTPDTTLGGNAEAYPEIIIHGGEFIANAGSTTARAVSSGGNTTIDGGSFTANAGTTTAYAIYAVAGKLDVSGVEVNAEANSTAAGVYVDCAVASITGFCYHADATLKNLTVNATTRTGNEAAGVWMANYKRNQTAATLKTDSTNNKWSAASYEMYKKIYPFGDFATSAKCSIIGGTYTATSAGTTAYGVRLNGPAISADADEDGEVAYAYGQLDISNATISAKTNGTTTVYGVWAGGPTTITNCNITASAKTTTCTGLFIEAGKTTLANSTITATGDGTVRGVYVCSRIAAVSSTQNVNTEFSGVAGFECIGELEAADNIVSATATNGNTAYAIYIHAVKGNTPSGPFAGDHAIAGKATINSGKYTATATGTTAYAIALADMQKQTTEIIGRPSCHVLGGKFYGKATGGTDGCVAANGQIDYLVLSGGFYNVETNLARYKEVGKNINDVPAGAPEYTEGYRYEISSELSGGTVCKVYQGNTLRQSYATLEEALQFVNANTGTNYTIVIVADYMLKKGDYLLPSNATLVIPNDLAQKAAIGTTPTRQNVNVPAPVQLVMLTFDNGVNMTVRGTIETSAVNTAANGGQAITGAPTGNYGRLHLVEGSTITLESGANLNCWGYTTGKGEINALNGAIVREGFQLGYWRGGTATSAMLNNKGTWHAFPVTDYFIQNVEAPITFRPGAQLLGYSAVNVSIVGIQAANNVKLIGTSQSMFLMNPADASEDTYVRKAYNAETDRAVWTVNSGAKIGSFSFSLAGNTVNSEDYYLPISNNMTIYVNEGEFIVTQDALLIPGAQIIISKLGKLTVSSGKRLFVMDNEDWPGFLKSGTTTVSRWYYNATYSPSWTSNPRTTLYPPTTTPLPDAEIFVEGETEGSYYTSTHGANIHSTNDDAGKVKFVAAAGANNSIQHVVNTDNERVTINFTTAQLKNELESPNEYTSSVGTVAGEAFVYMEKQWVKVTDGCLTTRTDGSGTHEYAKPSDVVEVVSNGDNAYRDVATGNRYFINAEKNLSDDECVWWEVEPVTSGTYAGDYMANQTKYDNYGAYYYYDGTSGYWKPRYVTVTWKNQDGSTLATYTNVMCNTSPKYLSASPTWANTAIEKHDWVGWRDEEGNIYDKNAVLPPAQGNVTYTAYYNTSKYQYTITFKNPNNSIIWAGLVEAGNVPVCPVTPTQASTVSTDYTFTNWSGYAAGANLPAVTAAATYTAVYASSTRKYHVAFYNYDAVSVLYEADVDYNTRPSYGGVTPFRANTSAYSYEWTGWRQGENIYDTDDELALVAGNVAYVATFAQTELRYQVFFKRQDGSIIDAPFFSFEETPAAFPANPTLASTVSTKYTFDHWDPTELVSVTEDGKVYTAYFSDSPRQYTAHFVNYDGTSLGVDQTIDYNTVPEYTGATPFHPNDSRNSFEFSGWAWEAGADWEAGSIDAGEAFPAIKGEITFKAQFTETLLQFNVLYVREDGTIILQDKKKWGESTAFPSPVASYEDETYSYTFHHWSPATVKSPVTADATYTAYFNQAIKTYSFSTIAATPAEYGSVSPASLASIPSGSAVTVDGNKITVNGTTITATPAEATAQYTYTFSHWNNVPATVTGNISDIEAVFTRTTNTYTVTWKNGDTTLETDENVPYGTTPTYDGVTPTKATDATYGYTFDGWDDGTSVYAVDALPTVSGAVTYTAHYNTAPTVASVTVGGATTYYATLQAAFDYAADKTTPTIKVLADIALTAKVTYTNTSKTTVTIDLNGHTVSGGLNPLLTLTSASSTGGLIVIKSSVEGGQIRNRISSTSARYCVSLSKGKLKLESGTIYNENTNTGASYAVSSSRTFTMTGGKLEAKGKTGVYPLYSTGTSNISGGSIVATETTSGTTAGVFAVAGTTTISDEVDVQVTGTSNVYGARVGLRPNTSGAVYNGTLNITGGTFNVHASTSSAGGVYSYAGTRPIDNKGNYACAGTANISGGEFTVTSDGAKAYGVYVTGTVSVATAKDADGNATYASASATSKANVTGGKFNISGTSDVMAVNTSAANTDLVVEGGWYNDVTNLDGYTAPTKSCNYHVLDLADKDPYKYEVAEAYTITFNNYDGDELQSGVQRKGSTPIYAAATPEKPQDDRYTYAFNEWSPALATVTAAVTYTATFTAAPRTFDITLNTNGGTINAGNVTSYTYGTGATLPTNVTKSGSEFGGWYDNEELTGDAVTEIGTTAFGNKEFWAKWNVTEYGRWLDIVDVDNENQKLLINVSGWPASGWPYYINGTEYIRDVARLADRTMWLPYTGEPGADFTITVRQLTADGALLSKHTYKIPMGVMSNTTVSVYETEPLFVNGTTMTVSQNMTATNIYVAPDAKLHIVGGKKLTVDTIFLRTTPISAAELILDGSLSEGAKVVYTRIISSKSGYFQFGLPLSCDINLEDIRLSDGTDPKYYTGSGWVLRTYDEESRAINGLGDNWVSLGKTEKIEGGKGYEMYSGVNYYREFYFPVNVNDLSAELPVAYTAGPNPVNNGWNMLVSPLTSTFVKEPMPEDLVVSWMEADGFTPQSVPSSISPAKVFAYQAAEAGTISFDVNTYAPIRNRIAAADEQTRIQWIHLDLTDANGAGDQTSIYAHPTRYEQYYQTGIDVAKQSLTASRAIIYSSLAYGDMAFAGVSDSLLEQGVALTIYNPSEQELTFSMRENRWLNRMALVWLVDTETGAQIDLLDSDYSVLVPAGTTRGRFYISGIFKAPQITTDNDNVQSDDEQGTKVEKLLINQKMYIKINGVLYDATGKLVNKVLRY